MGKASVNKIKEIRVNLDGLSKLTQASNGSEIGGTREMFEASESLLMSKAWLGKILEEMKVESPYPKDGERHSVKDIEPTADVAISTEVQRETAKDLGGVYSFDTLNQIEKIDNLRQSIQVEINNIKEIDTFEETREFAIARTNAYNYACEARFYLGFELARIRETNNN